MWITYIVCIDWCSSVLIAHISILPFHRNNLIVFISHSTRWEFIDFDKSFSFHSYLGIANPPLTCLYVYFIYLYILYSYLDFHMKKKIAHFICIVLCITVCSQPRLFYSTDEITHLQIQIIFISAKWFWLQQKKKKKTNVFVAAKLYSVAQSSRNSQIQKYDK